MRAGANGNFVIVLSETAKDFNDGNFRYLLLGILDKEVYGNRSWCPMYGFTEITPGRIRVNKIISSDGDTYFDLANNEIGGRINFKDGLVSGLIGVAGSTGKMKAGMNGEGDSDEDIRFWAGADEANMANAPWRVFHDGRSFQGNTEIYGNSSIRGFLFQKEIRINRNNYSQYIKYNEQFGISQFIMRDFGGKVFFEDDICLDNVEIVLPYQRLKDMDSIYQDYIDYVGKYVIFSKAKETTKPMRFSNIMIDDGMTTSYANNIFCFVLVGYIKDFYPQTPYVVFKAIRALDREGKAFYSAS